MEIQKNKNAQGTGAAFNQEIPLEAQAFLQELQEELAKDPVQKQLIERQLAMMLIHSGFFCAVLKTTPAEFMQQFSAEDIEEMQKEMLGADFEGEEEDEDCEDECGCC